MKKIQVILIIIIPLIFTSCIVVDHTPGPHGRDGNAYFGVDYEHKAPYSYWDNNNDIPFNPILGEYYHTYPGIYEFEYFINPHEYYYGTYEVWINRGGPGGPHGEHGYNGTDTYLMLIADPNGFHQHGSGRAVGEEPVVIRQQAGNYQYKITINRGNSLTRPGNQPKYISQ